MSQPVHKWSGFRCSIASDAMTRLLAAAFIVSERRITPLLNGMEAADCRFYDVHSMKQIYTIPSSGLALSATQTIDLKSFYWAKLIGKRNGASYIHTDCSGVDVLMYPVRLQMMYMVVDAATGVVLHALRAPGKTQPCNDSQRLEECLTMSV
eukprot:scaffold208085_cov18-Prasinocladus_malaysianus.AAC.3